MKFVRLSTILAILLLTGAMDYLLRAVPMLAVFWLCNAGLLGLAELARDLDRFFKRDLGLVKIPLGK